MIGLDVQRDPKNWYVSRLIPRELGGWQSGTIIRRLRRNQSARNLGELIGQMLGLPARSRMVHFATQTSWPTFDSTLTHASVELDKNQLTIVPMKVISPYGGLEGVSDSAVVVSATSSADEIGTAIDLALDRCGQPTERGSPRIVQRLAECTSAANRAKFEVSDRWGLVTALDSLGFFKFTPPDKIESAKRDFERTGLMAIFGDNGRMFHADAESLSQGGVGKFLRRIESFLTVLGAVLARIIEHFDKDGYRVTVNEWIYDIWLDTDKLDPWMMSTIRTFLLVNDILAQAGAHERMYAVNSGNDLVAHFLTPEMFDVICNHHQYRIPDYPYVPSESG
jgi:hypothetical protein